MRGFRVKTESTSTGKKWSGTFRCHCYKAPSSSARSDKRSLVSGDRIDCSCKWKVHFSVDHRLTPCNFHLTARRFLHHTGHSPVSITPTVSHHYTSLHDIGSDIRSFIIVMLKCNLNGEPRVKRYVEAVLHCTFDPITFHNLLNQCKEGAQVAHPSEDFHVLFEWLLREMASNKEAFARLSLDKEVGNELNSVLYMSADMVYNLKRNGTVLIMDTTFKTNRFHWPLLLVCGINEHFHTVLFAVALVRYQTTELFAWVLQQMREACGEEAWARVSVVATDGDKAMAAAIEGMLPSSRHLRCWYHLEQNMRHNLVQLGPLSMDDFNDFLVQWKEAALMEEEADFQAAKVRLHTQYPMAIEYLTDCIWPNEDAFLACRTKASTTLGILSTQRVEGLNSTLKHSFQVGSKTALVSLFSILEHAAEKKDRDAVQEMHKQDLLDAVRSAGVSFMDSVTPHISHWAAKKVRTEFEYIINYTCDRGVLGAPFNVGLTQQARDRGAVEVTRQVHVNEGVMKCSCCFPITFLLPCRHVLYLNTVVFKMAFRVDQVGQRWLRSFMPPANYSPNPLLSQIHSFSLSQPAPLIASVRVTQVPNEKGRYAMYERHGQDFARIMAPHRKWHDEVEAFWRRAIQWAEQMTGSDQVINLPPPDPALFSTTALHPSVPIECIPPPALPNAIPGRPPMKRKKGKGEVTQRKRGSVPATQ